MARGDEECDVNHPPIRLHRVGTDKSPAEIPQSSDEPTRASVAVQPARPPIPPWVKGGQSTLAENATWAALGTDTGIVGVIGQPASSIAFMRPERPAIRAAALLSRLAARGERRSRTRPSGEALWIDYVHPDELELSTRLPRAGATE
jgi:hypothetical protein